MSDDDYSGVRQSYDRSQTSNGGGGTGAGGGGGGGGKHRGPRFSWNSQFEATFFRSLCESVQLGLREGSTFKHEAWERALAALLERHHAYANKGHLINKSDNARKKFRLWRGLREDPEFTYNPNTHMVTASDEAWKRHVQREPLSRSLKGRPFEHEEFYEVLFPDVIGSGGAPKRVTKPRRKGPDDLSGLDEQETPGTAVMDLIGDAQYVAPPPARVPPAATIPVPVPQTTRPTSTALPPRTSIASTSALTPPEENAPNTRKRFIPASDGSGPSQSALYKRRRMTNMSTASSVDHNSAAAAATAPSTGFVDLTNNLGAVTAAPSGAIAPAAPAIPSSSGGSTTTAAHAASSLGANASALPADGVLALAEVLRAAAGRAGGALAPRWQEQAMEIFFRDFGDEDMDLQLKIAEKALTDENKALVFCKMPVALRRHWIKRLREVHNRGVN